MIGITTMLMEEGFSIPVTKSEESSDPEKIKIKNVTIKIDSMWVGPNIQLNWKPKKGSSLDFDKDSIIKDGINQINKSLIK